MSYQTIKGTYDLLPSQMKKFRFIENEFNFLAQSYGYSEIRTPVIEYTGVYAKENDTSDMVTKEMYTFSPNGKDSYTLRPEGTAGVVRSFVENKMFGSNELPLKLSYLEEMFRHERPQKGRQRQFTQFGVEVLGDKDPMIDAEVIAFGYNYVKSLGLQSLKVCINTLGDAESRVRYKDELIEYFKPHKDELCPDCQNRLEKNPLRILDCKFDHELDVIKNAPKMKLSEASFTYFEKVKMYLDVLNIPYIVDDRLVRGLDYYTDTVFEVISTHEESGAQSTIFGGGRYDNLVEELGGPSLSGIGFAIGAERLMILCEAEHIFDNVIEEDNIDAYVINLVTKEKDDGYALNVAQLLRENEYTCEVNFYERSLKSQFKSSERKKARFVLIIGEDEARDKTVTLKDTLTKAQESVSYDELVSRIAQIMEDYYE